MSVIEWSTMVVTHILECDLVSVLFVCFIGSVQFYAPDTIVTLGLCQLKTYWHKKLDLCNSWPMIDHQSIVNAFLFRNSL